MRGIAIALVVAWAPVAVAEPPTEDEAIRAASAWFSAARRGDAAALADVSARTVRVNIVQFGCKVAAVAKSRAAIRRVAKKLAACPLMAAPSLVWHARPPIGDTRVVGFSTTDESFVTVGVTVDANGRVTNASMTTSYGGDLESN